MTYLKDSHTCVIYSDLDNWSDNEKITIILYDIKEEAITEIIICLSNNELKIEKNHSINFNNTNGYKLLRKYFDINLTLKLLPLIDNLYKQYKTLMGFV